MISLKRVIKFYYPLVPGQPIGNPTATVQRTFLCPCAVTRDAQPTRPPFPSPFPFLSFSLLA